MMGGVLLSGSLPLLSFFVIAMVGAGSYGGHGPFWAIPTETLPRRVAGSAMGLINALGNLGGYFGPRVVGFLNNRSGNFVFGFGALSLGLLVGSAMAFLLPRSRGVSQPGGTSAEH